MNLVAPGFHLVRVARHASIVTVLAAIVTLALMPAMTVAAHSGRYSGMPDPAAMDGPDATANVDAASLGPTTVRVRSQQRLYRFAASASVTSERTVNFGVGAVFSSPGTIEKFGDRNYIQLTSGDYAGWWVAAPRTSASSITRFSTPLTLKVAARDYIGVRFYDRGDVRSRLSVTVGAETTYHADRKGTFDGRNFYRLTDGPLADRWVSARAVSVLKAGSGSGDDDPATTPVAQWRGVVLLYTETDVRFQKADGSTYHLQATMSNSMKNLVNDTLSRFHNSVRTWSGGIATLDLDIVNVPHAVTSLNLLGSTYWVGPTSVKDDIDQYARAGSYDSVFVVWQAKDSSGERVPTSAWGLTLPPGSWANGAGYSSIITPTWDWWWTDSVAPEEVFVHEWMHQVIFWNEHQGRTGIDLHAASQYGYQQVNGSWKKWLSDVMQGKVWDGHEYIGVTSEMWAADSPRNP